MKELSTKEKAKAYDEALERARIWQNNLYDTNDKDYADELNYIFPELIESEDERIRREIITYLSTAEDKELIPYESWLAWLEKQGQTFTKEEKVDNANKVEPKDYNGIDPYFGKPVDKVEPKFKKE